MSGIPDKAVNAAANELSIQILGAPLAELNEQTSNSFRSDAKWVLSAALPAIERAHLERLTAEAEAEWQEQAPNFPSAGLPYAWLRARLDQTKDPEQ